MNRLMPVGTLILVFTVFVTASAAGEPRAMNITVEQARKILDERGSRPDFIVLDVRTQDEFAAGHLPRAVNIDILAADFETRLRALDPEKTYLVYCRSGNRSARAVQTMQRMGFRSIYHMWEGTLGWQSR